MENKKYHTVITVLKSNRIIGERDKIDTTGATNGAGTVYPSGF
jgi:hypothetical protein